MAEMRQFVTSCGVEYGEGLCVCREGPRKRLKWTDEDYLNGVILPGRRLLNCKVGRFADGNMRDIHDELRAEGNFSILVLSTDDFGDKEGRSTRAADEICSKVNKKFPLGIVQPIVVHPHSEAEFQWTDLPDYIKRKAEMCLFKASTDVYDVYGADHTGREAGALVVVRPDGVVGMMTALEDIQQVVAFLKTLVRSG